MKKTIFIFRHYASTPDTPGGTEHFNLAAELVKEGMDIYIFTSNFNHLTKNNVKEFKGTYFIEKVDGVNVVWINTFNYSQNNWRRLVNMIDYSLKCYNISLAFLKNNIYPDVIIGSTHIFSVGIAYHISKRLGARYFIDIAELWPEVYVTSGIISKSNPIYIIIKKIMFYFYKHAEKMICFFEGELKYFEDTGLNEKIIYMPFGIKIENSFMVKQNISKPKEIKIIYAGSFQPLYPLDKAIMAAKIINDLGYNNIKLLFIGGGTQKKKLIGLTKKYNLENIEFKEIIPKKRDFLEFLETGSAFLLIEKNMPYGFPTKVLDYLYIGRPIIYALPPYLNKLLNSGCCIKASNENPESIAKAVLRVANMSEYEWKEMSLKGKKYLIENHNIEKISQRLINII